MSETPEARIKRMRMRAWRRGTKEMDLVLGPWADAHLDSLSEADLVQFDSILNETDQDLMRWILGGDAAPAEIAGFLDRITTFARTTLWKNRAVT